MYQIAADVVDDVMIESLQVDVDRCYSNGTVVVDGVVDGVVDVVEVLEDASESDLGGDSIVVDVGMDHWCH